MLSIELVVLSAAFLFFFGWFCDFLRQSPEIMATIYVFLSDAKWREIPRWVLKRSHRAFIRIFGEKMWSVRALLIICCYSLICNGVLFSSYYSRSLPIVGSLLGVLFCGLVHDLVSMQITRLIVSKIERNLLYVFVDTVLAAVLFVSTILTLQMGFSIGGYIIGGLFYQVLIAPGYHVSFFTYPWENFLRNPIGVFKYGEWLVMAATALFPTLAYVFAVILAFTFRILLVVAHKPVACFLNWLSIVESKRIGLFCSGLSVLVVLLTALRDFVRLPGG